MKLYFNESEINLDQFKSITYEEKDLRKESHVNDPGWKDYAESRGRNVEIRGKTIYWEEEFTQKYLLIDSLENFIFDICRITDDSVCFYRDDDRLFIKEEYSDNNIW